MCIQQQQQHIILLMKIALCFLISYKHIVNKEEIWREWIKPNEDIINVYFHYTSFSKITSSWIKQHALPGNYIKNTDYLHVVPAYLTLLEYGIQQDLQNNWFCFLTESCVPIISPTVFRRLFFENYMHSIMKWKPVHWNVNYTKRANLNLLSNEFHLFNTPWFVLSREDAQRCILYKQVNPKIYNLICNGKIANESIFAIMLKAQNQLEFVKNEECVATDWSRMTSPTSPYLFSSAFSPQDSRFVETFKKENKYTMFLRKVDVKFSNEILRRIIYSDM